MQKVMVVDDEKLVRQGIITTFPWRKHGFEVACDAGSGEKALEMLEREDIDLLVTDLAMNGMSGLELIKRVRQNRRDLPVVILTCHDNFKYIQEAMRLGVLDYIVKTEIEDEVVDETLMRISEKLKSGRKREPLPSFPAFAEAADEGMLLCGPSRSSSPREWLAGELAEGWAARLQEVDAATWLLWVTPAEAEQVQARIETAPAAKGWLGVRISGIGAEDEREMPAKLRRYRRHFLFYDAARRPVLAWAELPEREEPKTEDVSEISAGWQSPGWVYGEERFEALLRKTSDAGLGAADLRNAFYPVVLEWDRLLGTGALKGLLEQSDDWLYWRNWESWLRSFRRTIRRTVDKNAARQTADAIFKAVELLRGDTDPEAGEAVIAKAVNMSRGHFSKSFKKVTGQSYGEYARLLKLERAKEMILRTDEPISRVAELCGFHDYRYFSKVFREHTGMLPTEYRKTGSRGPSGGV